MKAASKIDESISKLVKHGVNSAIHADLSNFDGFMIFDMNTTYSWNISLGFQTGTTYNVNNKDSVIGITASGRTPYVLGGLKKCKEEGL